MIKQRTAGKFKLLNDARIDDLAPYTDRLIVPHTPAPVLLEREGRITLEEMKFSLVPSWAKEPRVKFATHNARLESIDEKPTWKHVFVKKHCVVPLTDFIEPIYEGEHAGHMVAFHDREGELILAAGVWEERVNKSTGEVIHSFAIITHDPPPFVAGIGHDRCPVFLDEKAAREWLSNGGSAAHALKEFLVEKQIIPDFQVENHRAMKPGWEKRR